jgi:hypothetical protein
MDEQLSCSSVFHTCGARRPLYLNAAPLLYTDRRTAELIKYAANAFLAMKITFINEIADLCEKAGADVQDVAPGIGLDNRIGTKFLHAGQPRFDQDRAGLRRAAAAGRDGRGGERPAEAMARKMPQDGPIDRAMRGVPNDRRRASFRDRPRPRTWGYP